MSITSLLRNAGTKAKGTRRKAESAGIASEFDVWPFAFCLFRSGCSRFSRLLEHWTKLARREFDPSRASTIDSVDSMRHGRVHDGVAIYDWSVAALGRSPLTFGGAMLNLAAEAAQPPRTSAP